MADLAARGYTGVLHTFSENDLAYYRDTMRELVDVSHAAGLSVQASPWGLGRTFGGEAESRFGSPSIPTSARCSTTGGASRPRA